MTVSAPTRLVDGLVFGEGPRWRGDRLWFSDMHGEAIHTVDLDGRLETVVEVPGRRPSGLGFLPDGTLLIVSMLEREVLRWDGADLTVHADLRALVPDGCNDMVVDARGERLRRVVPAHVGSRRCRRPRTARRHGRDRRARGPLPERLRDRGRRPGADRGGVARPSIRPVRHRRRRQPVRPHGVRGRRPAGARRHLSRCRGRGMGGDDAGARVRAGRARRRDPRHHRDRRSRSRSRARSAAPTCVRCSSSPRSSTRPTHCVEHGTRRSIPSRSTFPEPAPRDHGRPVPPQRRAVTTSPPTSRTARTRTASWRHESLRRGRAVGRAPRPRRAAAHRRAARQHRRVPVLARRRRADAAR